jgi:hypothetical protein
MYWGGWTVNLTNIMAAVFYNSSQNESLFKGDIAVVNAVQIDFLKNFVGPASMAIITSVGAQNGDIFQYFITFDDVISYFYFGRGIGTITVSGIIFADCRGQMNGLNDFYVGGIGGARGRPVNVSIGRTVFRGVVSNFTTNTVADPNYMTEFTVTIQVLSHNIPVYVNAAGQCSTRLRQPVSNVTTNATGSNNTKTSSTGGLSDYQYSMVNPWLNALSANNP